MVDAVVADDDLEAAARDLLTKAINGEFDWKARKAEKTGPLKLNKTEAAMVFETSKGYVMGQTKGNYPAPIEAIQRMAQAAHMSRDEALKVESEGFIKVAKSPQAAALIQLFLNDQLIKKKGKKYGKIAHEVKQAAVLGAGIMGGGIAYQSAYKGVPTLMKDIKEEAIDQGLEEAAKHFAKGVERGKIDNRAMAEGMSRIRPTLSYAEFDHVDAVIEAVVENPKIKKSVLAETEEKVSDQTILASNTSSISIDDLATALKRPENFLGMHFFNPVHRMPLVEVIRGKASSDEAVATVVDFAHKLGKTPIVVNDCPGFLVNRDPVPVFLRLPAADRRRRGFRQDRQGDGEVRLADGPGLSVRRGRHGYLAARRGSAGRRLSGPHEAGREVVAGRDGREQPPRPEDRLRLLQVREGQEGQAEALRGFRKPTS